MTILSGFDSFCINYMNMVSRCRPLLILFDLTWKEVAMECFPTTVCKAGLTIILIHLHLLPVWCHILLPLNLFVHL